MELRKTGVILLALLLAAMAMVPCMSAAENVNVAEVMSDPYYSEAIKIVSNENAIPVDHLIPLNTGIASYPLTNKKLHSIKLLDQTDGNTYTLHLDDNNKVANPKLYSEKENSEFSKLYGKFEPELSDRIKTAKSDEIIPVWIWLQNPSDVKPLPDGVVSIEEKKSDLKNMREIYKSNSKNVVDLLTEKGVKISYVSEYSPSLFAEVPMSVLKVLEENSDITAIYLQRAYQPQLYSAARAIKANSVWNQGITGSGVKVAVMEAGRIAYANPYLNDGNSYNPSGPISDHATAVAGMIGSTHSTNKGIGYGVSLMSANANSVYDTDQISACEWAITNNADIISISMGAETDLNLNPMDKYLDHIVQNHHKTVVVAAGNSASGGTGQVMSPGLGYNMITVGALDDKDTVSLTDDTMSTYSSYKNPHSNYEDREKPEVVAPGGEYGSSTMKSTMTVSPWISDRGAGTSYAAPIIAGEAALLMQQQSSLKTWPETLKAIIMSSAIHNLEGDSRLSDHDGAGGVDASKARTTIINNRYQSNTLYSSSFPQSHTVYLQAGQVVRAVASWDSLPTNTHPPNPMTDTLMADLDLVVFNPGGSFVTNSNSWDNNYEIVEFVASTTGNYNIRLDKSRFDGSSERVGFAYTIY